MTRLFLCPGMGGISQRAMDGGVNMPRDGRADILLLQYLHFHHPCWSYLTKSQDGGTTNISQSLLPNDNFTCISLDIIRLLTNRVHT